MVGPPKTLHEGEGEVSERRTGHRSIHVRTFYLSASQLSCSVHTGYLLNTLREAKA